MLITESYRKLNSELHERLPAYGDLLRAQTPGGEPRRSHLTINAAIQTATDLKLRTVLDYGCGKGALKDACPPWLEVREYDPAIPGKDSPPEPAEMVTCFDVLEHIEPACLGDVLDHIYDLAKTAVMFKVHMKPALKTLADGRNAHLIIEGPKFWVPLLSTRWATKSCVVTTNSVAFIGVP